MTSKGKLPIIELTTADETGNISIDHGELSKQIIEALAWLCERYRVPQPKVLPVNGMLRARGILLDGFFMLGREKESGKMEAVILLSRKPRQPVLWVLFHEFWHYREYLRTMTMPNFISLNSPEEKDADRIATLDFRAYNTGA
jgi:hypothetical protein